MTYNMSPVKDMCPGFTAELWAVLKSKDYTSVLFIHSAVFLVDILVVVFTVIKDLVVRLAVNKFANPEMF